MQREILNRADTISDMADQIRNLAKGGSSLPPHEDGDDDDDGPDIGQLESPYLIVGKGSAAPGGLVHINVVGETDRLVTGFEVGFGLHADFAVTTWKVHSALLELLDLNDPSDKFVRGKEHRAYGKGNYVHAYVGFFEQVMGAEDTKRAIAELKKIDTQLATGKIDAETHLELKKTILAEMRQRRIKEVRIPPMTPLITVTLRVPPQAPPGKRYSLLCRHNWFGRKLSSNGPWSRLPISCIYATRDKQIDANLMSGWVHVS